MLFFSGNAWERRSRTNSAQTLFISIFYMDCYMDMLYECDNAFPNLRMRS